MFGDPIPPGNIEILKDLIREVALRKLKQLREEKSQNDVNMRGRHIIHKAIRWKRMLDAGEFKSQIEIAEKEGLSRVRVTQIMNLLKLPFDWKEFLTQLSDHKEIRKYSERRLRNYDPGRYVYAPPVSKKPCHESVGDISKKSRSKGDPPPKITVVEIDEPLSYLNLEKKKKLIQKAALRKLKELEDEENKRK